MLTIIIKTKNNEDTISETLESVKDLGNIVVIDEHSTDDTILISEEYKAGIVYSSPMEFDIAFNQIVSESQNEWVLLLERNEVIPQKLGNEILKYIEKPKKNKNAIYIPNKLFYLNKEIKCARKYNLKLFKKYCAKLINNYSVDLKPVKTRTHKIGHGFRVNKNCILKFQKHNICEIFRKNIDEIIIKSKDKNTKRASIFIKPFFKFIKLYIFKKGFLGGRVGFIYCATLAIKIFIFECTKYEKNIL